MTARNVLCLLWVISTVNALTHNVIIRGSLMDTDLKIDPCVQLNDRDQAVLPGTWYHRRTPALWINGDDTTYNSGTAPSSAYNFYSISSIGTHTGVVLEICEPDFAIMRDEQRDECYDSTVTEPCQDYGAEWCDLTMGSNSRFQMLRYSFREGYGCFTEADLTIGKTLSSPDFPNRLDPCPSLGQHATFLDCVPGETDCCDFACPADNNYNKNVSGRSCDPKCGSVADLSCGAGEYASEVCALMTPSRYTCTACPERPGYEFAAWDASAPTQCQYSACDPGYFAASSTAGCAPCPQDTFAPSSNTSACTPVPVGSEALGTGQTQAVPCFASGQVPAGATCLPGQEISVDPAAMTAFLSSDVTDIDDATAAELSLKYCKQGYACLSCLPGSRLDTATGKCELCALGYYQPAFQQETCLPCAEHQTTLATGAVSAEACVCLPGAE